jgi:carotenoid 1,2-hydratase
MHAHEPPGMPAFARTVPAGGYAWWYVDALSDDGRDGITVIAFIGSVFSPYYAAARRRARHGGPDPLDHCALNVALYGRARRWAMTERGRAAVRAGADALSIGPSVIAWDGAGLTIRFDEVAAPLPSRVRGTLRLVPEIVLSHAYALDAVGAHRWQPIAPLAVAEVDLQSPRLSWRGPAYFDANFGDTCLESAFVGWNWARARLAGGDAAVLYDVERIDGSRVGLSLRFDSARGAAHVPAPPRVVLPASRWGLPRASRADHGHAAACSVALEDGPFYARSRYASRLHGERADGVHETVSLERFRKRWVQWMLPFRMPRTGQRDVRR